MQLSRARTITAREEDLRSLLLDPARLLGHFKKIEQLSAMGPDFWHVRFWFRKKIRGLDFGLKEQDGDVRLQTTVRGVDILCLIELSARGPEQTEVVMTVQTSSAHVSKRIALRLGRRRMAKQMDRFLNKRVPKIERIIARRSQPRRNILV